MSCVLQLKALSEDDLAHYWRLYVDKLADLLAEADARTHGPAPDLARRVQSLQREALFLHIRQGTLHQSLSQAVSLTRSCARSLTAQCQRDLHGGMGYEHSLACRPRQIAVGCWPRKHHIP